MRRKDREITDKKKMLEIMNGCDCCRVSFPDTPAPYIVPLNFGFRENNGKIVLYFHSAKEGKKIDLAEKNPVVGFEMDGKHELVTGSIACDYGFLYRSIIGFGQLSLILDVEEKREALTLIMNHYEPRDHWDFNQQMLDAVAVMRLEVQSWTAKEH